MTPLFLLMLACGTAPSPGASPAPATAPAAPAPAPAASAPAAAPGGGTVYGDSFEPQNPFTATALTQGAAEHHGKEVTVKGTIRTVCQAKGCWHRLATDDAKTDVLVKASRYHVFLPKDAAGRTAIVKGTFSHQLMPLDEAKHFAEDAGLDPNTVTEAPMTYGIDASGVILM